MIDMECVLDVLMCVVVVKGGGVGMSPVVIAIDNIKVAQSDSIKDVQSDVFLPYFKV